MSPIGDIIKENFRKFPPNTKFPEKKFTTRAIQSAVDRCKWTGGRAPVLVKFPNFSLTFPGISYRRIKPPQVYRQAYTLHVLRSEYSGTICSIMWNSQTFPHFPGGWPSRMKATVLPSLTADVQQWRWMATDKARQVTTDRVTAKSHHLQRCTTG